MPAFDVNASRLARDAAAPRESPSNRFNMSLSWSVARPVIAEGSVVHSTFGGLIALDAKTGQERWRDSPFDTLQFFRSPAVHDGTVYVTGADIGLVALDTTDGSVGWTLKSNTSVEAPPAPAGRWEPLCVGDETGEVARVTLDGEVAWRTNVYGNVTRLVANRTDGVSVGTSSGEVYFLYEGRGMWRQSVPGEVTALAGSEGSQTWLPLLLRNKTQQCTDNRHSYFASKTLMNYRFQTRSR